MLTNFDQVTSLPAAQGLSAEATCAALQAAAAHPACSAFNSLSSADAVEAAAAAGHLPPILSTDETLAGIWHEFDTASSWKPPLEQATAQKAGGSSGSAAAPEASAGPARAAAAAALPEDKGEPLVAWRPLIWFRFHSHRERKVRRAGRDAARVHYS